jgi:hypothetical protein
VKHNGLRATIALLGAVRSSFLAAISKLTGFPAARTSLKFIVVMLAVLMPASLVFFASNLRSQTSIVVNNLSDPRAVSRNGFCTLREAINNANAAGDTTNGDCAAGTGNDDITFSLGGVITLRKARCRRL